ncbi:hypothetical protein FIBSPDRAFT_705446, partial [Athelia psychrophila]
MVNCTPTKKARILDMRNDGKQFSEIGTKLGLDPSTVSHNYAKMVKNPDPYAKAPGRGRPTKVDPRKLRRAVRACDSGTAVDATNVKQQMFPELSTRTVQRHLAEAGLNGRVRRATPYLKPLH